MPTKGTKPTQIRFTEAELAAIDRLAKAWGVKKEPMTRAAVLRRLIAEADAQLKPTKGVSA